MRSALWILILFASAVAVALFLSSNGATVTVFWPPYRVDMSLNLLLLVLACSFAFLLLLTYALLSIWRMPTEAKVWRAHRQELAAYCALARAGERFMQGQWEQAIKDAEQAQQLAAALPEPQPGPLVHKDEDERQRLLAVSQWLRARAAQQQATPATPRANISASAKQVPVVLTERSLTSPRPSGDGM